MVGHVAQSVGGALPGAGGGNLFLGQMLIGDPAITSAVVPAASLFVFAELVGTGAYAISSGERGGGGAGSDAILAVTAGETLALSIPSAAGSTASTTLSRGSTVLLSAASGAVSGAGGAGKYPGATVSTPNVGGKGGGRLGGPGCRAGGGQNGSPMPGGPGGGGAANSSFPCEGMRGLVCLTFFASYDAALAFANSLYNGAWQP